jgi:hypothetical protein
LATAIGAGDDQAMLKHLSSFDTTSLRLLRIAIKTIFSKIQRAIKNTQQ